MNFWLVPRVPEAKFLLLVLVLFDGLAQLSTDRKPAKSRSKGEKGKKKGKSSYQKMESRQTLVHLEFCRNHRHHVQSLGLQRPRNVRLKLVCLSSSS